MARRENERIPPEWFLNIKRKELFAGLRREGWEERKGGKHLVFTKEGYGQIILRYGGKSPPDNKFTARHFVEAGVSREEVERILGRKEKGRYSTL